MSFTRRQQGIFRPLLASAWSSEAPRIGCDPADRSSQDAWYRGQLHALFGVHSSRHLSPGDDFEVLCAHLEAIADDGSTYWRQRLTGGHRRRLLHSIRARCAGRALPEQYLRGIAAQSLGTDPSQIDIEALTPHQLHLLLLAAVYHLDRHPELGHPTPAQTP
jgi:hypothetical protein